MNYFKVSCNRKQFFELYNKKYGGKSSSDASLKKSTRKTNCDLVTDSDIKNIEMKRRCAYLEKKCSSLERSVYDMKRKDFSSRQRNDPISKYPMNRPSFPRQSRFSGPSYEHNSIQQNMRYTTPSQQGGFAQQSQQLGQINQEMSQNQSSQMNMVQHYVPIAQNHYIPQVPLQYHPYIPCPQIPQFVVPPQVTVEPQQPSMYFLPQDIQYQQFHPIMPQQLQPIIPQQQLLHQQQQMQVQDSLQLFQQQEDSQQLSQQQEDAQQILQQVL